jgi:hypothetical protein
MIKLLDLPFASLHFPIFSIVYTVIGVFVPIQLRVCRPGRTKGDISA